MILVLVTIFLLTEISANDNLQMAYRWKKLRIAFASITDTRTALATKEYIPENHLPFAMDVYKDRMFIAIPRLKPGIAASLAFIKLSEADNDHPLFYPYPRRQFHNIQIMHSRKFHPFSVITIVSAISLRVDRCDRLWVLDKGIFNNGTGLQRLKNPRVFIFNLRNNSLQNIYTIPDTQVSDNSSFDNMVVEDQDCENSFAYLADADRPAMVVYSYKQGRSWLVTQPYFHKRSESGHITFKDTDYIDTFQFGLFGMALSRPDPDGYSTMYFHPMWGDEEFAVNTKVLRNEALVSDDIKLDEFRKLGTRGLKGESGAMFLDQNLDVLVFASIHKNQVNCWRTTKPYSRSMFGTILSNSSVFPNDVKIDANGTVWVLSNNLPVFLGDPYMDAGLHNYAVFKGNILDVVKDTPCDSEIAAITRRKSEEISHKRLGSNSSGRDLCRDILSLLIFVIVVISM